MTHSSFRKWLLTACLLVCAVWTKAGNDFADTSRVYALPHLSATPGGTIGMSWTETDADGITYFYWAESRDKGKTFGSKKLIYSAQGIRNGRLMRAKVLYKKDGTMVAVFGLSPQPAPQAASAGHAHHGQHAEPAKEAPKKAKGGRPTDLQIVYSVSKDKGAHWSAPQTVHKDKTPNVIRGFYDSVVLPNDEIGVAFLKDTGRPHERDLRFVSTENGVFGEEKVIDPFVCDCCNVSLLTDAGGALNIYYRANINNIRDMAKMTSTDNGRTFSKSSIILNDNWEIKGCPHSGPVSVSLPTANVVAWFSGAPEMPGVRVATQDGKRLTVLDPAATNPWLAAGKKGTVVLWEHPVQESGSVSATHISYKALSTGLNSGTTEIKSLGKGANFTGIVTDNALLVAYEVKGANDKTTLRWTKVPL